MEHCLNCGAPLDPDNARCTYCGTYQPIDLRLLGDWSVTGEKASATCPECRSPMQSIRQAGEYAPPLLHCPKCNGLALSTSALPGILNAMTPQVLAADRKLIEALLKAHPLNAAVHYRPCPLCGVLMNRHSAGERSGVIVDFCVKDDLTWLDDGKLKHLCDWHQAGGGILDSQARAAWQPPPSITNEGLYWQNLDSGSPSADAAPAPPPEPPTTPQHNTLAERVAKLMQDESK